MKFISSIILSTLCLLPTNLHARDCHLPTQWQKICPILQARVNQTAQKMKLQESTASGLENYLQTTHFDFKDVYKLQFIMPKTSTELLMATFNRGLNKREADNMAGYLIKLIQFYQFKNLSAFDNNTSHIIGRKWQEIDYSGEGMTWQRQKQKYAPYGIIHFNSLNCLEKFFRVESKLPYFNKIYQPNISKK